MASELNNLVGKFKQLKTQGLGSLSSSSGPRTGGPSYNQYPGQQQQGYHPPPNQYQQPGYGYTNYTPPPQQHQQQGHYPQPQPYSPVPPPIPANRPDQTQLPPPQPEYATKPVSNIPPTTSAYPETSDYQTSTTSGDIKYGAIYKPGTYPTPELFSYPLGPHKVLNEGPRTAAAIQAALDALGPSSTLYLPKGSKWIIEKPLVLQPHQELATQGYPTAEKEMALLEASRECKPYIFECWDKTGIRIRNLIMEGGREKYGWSEHCGVMVSLGHTAHNQVSVAILAGNKLIALAI
jgi:hypothetical protein